MSFERLEELFHSASALPPGERDAFLDEHCLGNLALRDEVAAMLRAGDAGVILDSPVLDQIEDRLEGGNAGRWRVGARIGEGGLGVVHHAVSTSGSPAAIKFLRPGLDAGSFRRRFIKERRILASLHHPGIARLLDGGIAEDGRAFLVMEFVDGTPLDEYLERAGLSVSERVKLARRVCEAIQYLHNALVAHGDLKPSNILVDAGGETKLVDFGAARLLHPDDTASQETTLTRAFLTPHYASPEQKRGNGPSVASDIYSVGLILREILPAPDRDLDAICEMCCRPEPGDRYGSVLELDQDLERYLRRKPVHARRQNLYYRTAKFVHRNVAAVSIVAAVVAAAATSLAFAWRERERERAQYAEMRAMVQSLASSGASPVTYRKEDRDALISQLATAIKAMEAKPEPGSELDLAAAWNRLAGSRAERGEQEAALEAAERANRLATTVWEQRRAAEALEPRLTAVSAMAMILNTRGRVQESDAAMQQAISVLDSYVAAKGAPPPAPHAFYSMVALLGPALAESNRPELARRAFVPAIAANKAAGTTEMQARAMVQLSRVERSAGNPAVAQQLCRDAARLNPVTQGLRENCAQEINDPSLAGAVSLDSQIALVRARYNAIFNDLARDPDRFQTRHQAGQVSQHLALLLRQQGREEEARPLLERAVSIYTELLGRDPDNQVIRSRLTKARKALKRLPK